MRIVVVFLSVVILAFIQKAELDPRLIGRWVNLFSKDTSGQVQKNMISGKNYVETFSKNGKLILDPQFLR